MQAVLELLPLQSSVNVHATTHPPRQYFLQRKNKTINQQLSNFCLSSIPRSSTQGVAGLSSPLPLQPPGRGSRLLFLFTRPGGRLAGAAAPLPRRTEGPGTEGTLRDRTGGPGLRLAERAAAPATQTPPSPQCPAPGEEDKARRAAPPRYPEGHEAGRWPEHALIGGRGAGRGRSVL